MTRIRHKVLKGAAHNYHVRSDIFTLSSIAYFMIAFL
jgi:hypothetical protein